MTNFNYITVRVKCLACNKSLMDSSNKVDNEESIKLLIKTTTQEGTIWLSSIYGNHKHSSDINLVENEIVTFFCPHCKTNIATEDYCVSCKAPMASLALDKEGKINFCSRKGCLNHNVGFEDLSRALTQFYQEFGYQDKKIHGEFQSNFANKKKESPEDEQKFIIESGSFLQSFCPYCRKSLIEDGLLKLKVINNKKEEGFVFLSPYLNVFSSKSTIFLPELTPVGGIFCNHCNASLIEEDKKCDRCGTDIAKIMVNARTKMIDFYICSKKGCSWHGLNKNDLDDIRLEDSLEW